MRLACIFDTSCIFRRKYHQRKELNLKRFMQFFGAHLTADTEEKFWYLSYRFSEVSIFRRSEVKRCWTSLEQEVSVTQKAV